MAIILNIDTATERTGVCLADGKKIVAQILNDDAKQTASFLQPAIQNICDTTGISLNAVDAVAVSNGPGSYTGLRVGLSSAKGICYALNKPLILVNTLEIMCDHLKASAQSDDLICPMIDARRMEVFTAVFDTQMKYVIEPQAMVLEENSFSDLLKKHRIIFGGSGAEKWQKIVVSSNTVFVAERHSPENLNNVAQKRFEKRLFDDLAYSEPFYLKPFFDTHKH